MLSNGIYESLDLRLKVTDEEKEVKNSKVNRGCLKAINIVYLKQNHHQILNAFHECGEC